MLIENTIIPIFSLWVPSPITTHNTLCIQYWNAMETKSPQSAQSCWTLTPSRDNPVVQTKFGGTVRGESAMVNTSDVGSLVEFTFKVSHLHHSDHIRPPRLYIVSTICVLLSHISLVSTLSLTLQLLFCGSSILLGEEIVMWAMVYGVSMTGVDAILELQSSPAFCLRHRPIFPFSCRWIVSPLGAIERAAPGRLGDPGCGVWMANRGAQRQVAALPDEDRGLGKI